MIEIAGGILLALSVLILIFANFGRVVFLLYISFLIGLAYGGWLVFASLPAGARSLILFFAVMVGGVLAIGVWSFADKRFLLPEGQDSVRLSNRAVAVTFIALVASIIGGAWIVSLLQ